jgi:6-phosphogluconolactonase
MSQTGTELKVEVVEDLAGASAAHLVELMRRAIAERGRCVLALSGGGTPQPMCGRLFNADLDWSKVVITQVDERVAPAGDDARNWQMISETMEGTPALAATLLPMPVEAADLDHATTRYADTLREFCGRPAVIDVVQLGLGADGHTASLVPDDPVLQVDDTDVATTANPYEGLRRMTLTYPALNRARHIVWMVAGVEKADALQGMIRRDASLPASGIRRDAIAFVDPAAAGES